jgi:hypothetical protein
MNPEDFDTFDSTLYAPQFMKKSHQINSRLAKREQTKVARQTLLLVLFSIVMVLGFIFVALPTVVRVAMDGGVSIESEINDIIPPQTPNFSAPPSAVSQSIIEITGFAEPKSEIQSLINKKLGPTTTVGDDGSFALTLDLVEGENSLALYAVDLAGNESNLSREYTIISKVGEPKFVLEEPKADAIYETASNQTITLKGETDPKSKVYVNGRLMISDQAGVFQGKQRLNEGVNQLVFKVIDIAGNEIEKTIEVEFRY